jgi:hypothetical protein
MRLLHNRRSEKISGMTTRELGERGGTNAQRDMCFEMYHFFANTLPSQSCLDIERVYDIGGNM